MRDGRVALAVGLRLDTAGPSFAWLRHVDHVEATDLAKAATLLFLNWVALGLIPAWRREAAMDNQGLSADRSGTSKQWFCLREHLVCGHRSSLGVIPLG